MTTEEQKLALLEWAGWKKCICGDEHCGAWFPPNSKEPEFEPNLSSLDTIAEFEGKLTTPELVVNYYDNLMDVVKRTHKERTDSISAWSIHANAEQRLEALVRTLGLWKE